MYDCLREVSAMNPKVFSSSAYRSAFKAHPFMRDGNFTKHVSEDTHEKPH